MPHPVRVALALTFCALAAVSAQATATALVSGQIIESPGGRPIGGAVVTVVIASGAPAAGQPPAPARRAVAVANAEGRFVFRDLPAGVYTITSTRDGYAPGATGRRRPGGPGQPLTVAEGARLNNVVLSMWRLAAISGVVRDDRGDPAVGISVWAMRRVLNAGRLELTFDGGTVEAADDRGHYRLSNLMPGQYVLAVRSTPQSVPVATVEAYQAAVTSGATAAMETQWRSSGAIRLAPTGLVQDDWRVSSSSSEPQPLPGPNGTLLVQPTVYYPNVRTPGEATVITLGAGDDRPGIDLTLSLAAAVRVSGVLMGPDGPAPNHGLRLVPVTPPNRLAHEIPAAYSISDAAGRFAFLGVSPGTYVVRAYRVTPTGPVGRFAPPAAGGLPVTTVEPIPAVAAPALFGEATVTVGSSPVEGVTITLQPGARLLGRVVFDGATKPPAPARLQQMTLTIRPLSGSVQAADTRVDAEGGFVTSGYPPDRYHVFNMTPPGPEWTLASVRIGNVDAAGQAFTLGDRDIEGVVVTFTDKVTSLSGVVQAAESGGSPESTVVMLPADVQAWLASGMSPRRVVTAVASPTGTYQMRIPLPGDYMVVAVPPEIAPDVDGDFVAKFAAGAVRLSFAIGETKTQALTVTRR